MNAARAERTARALEQRHRQTAHLYHTLTEENGMREKWHAEVQRRSVQNVKRRPRPVAAPLTPRRGLHEGTYHHQMLFATPPGNELNHKATHSLRGIERGDSYFYETVANFRRRTCSTPPVASDTPDACNTPDACMDTPAGYNFDRLAPLGCESTSRMEDFRPPPVRVPSDVPSPPVRRHGAVVRCWESLVYVN